jgi:pimeloyl-ACP methyl ester carboxylesterase
VTGVQAADGIDLYFEVAGDGPRTLALVNGVGDPLEGWANQIGEFLAAGLRVVSFDNRGVGRSGRPPGVVPGGHAAFWEDPGPWNQAVLEFVRAHR